MNIKILVLLRFAKAKPVITSYTVQKTYKYFCISGFCRYKILNLLNYTFYKAKKYVRRKIKT